MPNIKDMTAPRYVNEGMIVYAPFKVVDNRRQFLRCEVTTAAGYHARVENELRKFVQWFHIDHLLIDPQGQK